MVCTYTIGSIEIISIATLKFNKQCIHACKENKIESLSSMIMFSTYMSCDMNKEDQIRTQNNIYRTFMEIMPSNN